MAAPVKTESPTRRERLFAATQAELSQAARELLVEGGPEAVTVRAVAERVGMTAPAIYRYFPSRELLLARVCVDLYAELGQHLYAVRDSTPGDSVAERLCRTARAFREWAIEHTPEFGLLFGAPIPGVVVDPEAKHEEIAGQSFALVWLELFAEIEDVGTGMRWNRPIPRSVAEQIDDFACGAGFDIDTRAAVLYVYCWQSLYGAVATEVFGHMKWAVDDASEFFEGRLAELLVRLGLKDAGSPDVP
ncbi:TetR/AcrR family transcriptional regulator [Monashia sp. NPDC004114]